MNNKTQELVKKIDSAFLEAHSAFKYVEFTRENVLRMIEDANEYLDNSLKLETVSVVYADINYESVEMINAHGEYLLRARSDRTGRIGNVIVDSSKLAKLYVEGVY